MKNLNWLFNEMKSIRIDELTTLKKLYKKNNVWDKIDGVQEEIDFLNFKYTGFDINVFENRFCDFLQLIAGYHYTIAEDFMDNNLMKIENLRKSVICCNLLKANFKESIPYSNKYICQQNRNYLN